MESVMKKQNIAETPSSEIPSDDRVSYDQGSHGPAPVPAGAGPSADSLQRFAQASHALAAVTAREKREVAEFQTEMGKLTEIMKDMERGLNTYQENLDRIRIRRLGRKARRLARIMDGYLSKQG